MYSPTLVSILEAEAKSCTMVFFSSTSVTEHLTISRLLLLGCMLKYTAQKWVLNHLPKEAVYLKAFL